MKNWYEFLRVADIYVESVEYEIISAWGIVIVVAVLIFLILYICWLNRKGKG